MSKLHTCTRFALTFCLPGPAVILESFASLVDEEVEQAFELLEGLVGPLVAHRGPGFFRVRLFVVVVVLLSLEGIIFTVVVVAHKETAS